ncbi:acyltransferase [Escherichia coli]|nr:acyltransferase [Escherichia coli]
MRVNSIDHLRGCLAICIVIYHLTAWVFGPPDPSGFLAKIGLYGVSIFFCISGAALYLAHYKDAINLRFLSLFFLRRYFRIAPGYIVALTLFVFFHLIFSHYQKYSFETLLLNATLLFGFFDISGYVVTGGWSIGNEFVYYSLFPLIIIMMKKPFWSIIILSLSIASWSFYGMFYIKPEIGIVEQWGEYINPFNNIIFFVSGMFIAKVVLFKVGFRPKVGSFIALISLILLILVDVSHSATGLVTGQGRLWLTLLSIAIFLGVLLIGDLVSNRKLVIILNKLGELSFSLYIIHGITYYYMLQLVGAHLDEIGKLMFCGMVFTVSIMLSLMISYMIEKPFIKLSKKITLKLND